MYINTKNQDATETFIDENEFEGKRFYLFSKYITDSNLLTDSLAISFIVDAQKNKNFKGRSFDRIIGEVSLPYDETRNNLSFNYLILKKDNSNAKGIVQINCSILTYKK